MRARTAGVTLTELLVALTVLAMVLGIVGAFLGQQAELNRRTQLRNETQDRVRTVMQLVLQDLQLAGSSRYITDAGLVLGAPSMTACPTDPDDASVLTCIKGQENNERDELSMVYISSLFPSASACRRVAYSFEDTARTLFRADEPCDAPLTMIDPDNPPTPNPLRLLAPEILALDVQFICSTGDTVDRFPDSNCEAPDGYARSAVVTVIGRSEAAVDGLPRTRYTTVTGKTVTCGPDFVCFELTQEVLLPNLKDN